MKLTVRRSQSEKKGFFRWHKGMSFNLHWFFAAALPPPLTGAAHRRASSAPWAALKTPPKRVISRQAVSASNRKCRASFSRIAASSASR